MSAITNEQRGAWAEVKDQAADVAALLAPLLPDALTNPQPALPTDAGWYADIEGDPWQLTNDGTWLLGHTPLNSPEDFAPFTRLVPERPQVTSDQIRDIVGEGALMPSEVIQLMALLNGLSA